MINNDLIFDRLQSKMEAAGFHFEKKQKPYMQSKRGWELKFIHPQLVKKWQEAGPKVRAKKFYIKQLSDESSSEIGLVTGKSSPLKKVFIYSPPNSLDSFDDCPAWVDREGDQALDSLLCSIKKYLDN